MCWICRRTGTHEARLAKKVQNPSQDAHSPTKRSGSPKAGKGGRHILVKKNRMNQYMTSTGQKTGTLNTSNQLHTKAMATARVAQYQNLNSGRRRMKGRNSSSALVGRLPAPP